MDVFGLAAVATIIRFIFWLYEMVIKTLDEVARKRRTMHKVKGPGEKAEDTPQD